MSELHSPKQPFVHRTSSETEVVSFLLSADFAAVLNGARMRTTETFFAEYARAFAFPGYFGRNWAAFDECIQDLDWLPARSYATVILNSSDVLEDEGRGQAALIDTLEDAGLHWSRRVGLGYERGYGEVPFNTILFDRR